MTASLLHQPLLSSIPRSGWSGRVGARREPEVDALLADALGHAFLAAAEDADAKGLRTGVAPDALIEDHFVPIVRRLSVVRQLPIDLGVSRDYAHGFAAGVLASLARKVSSLPTHVSMRSIVCGELRVVPAYIVEACQVVNARGLPDSWAATVQAAEHGALDLLVEPPVFVPVLRLIGEERGSSELSTYLMLAQSATSNNASGTWLEMLAHRPVTAVAELILRYPIVRRLNNFLVGSYHVEALGPHDFARSTTTGDLMRVERVDHAERISVVSHVLLGPNNWVTVPPSMSFAYEAAIVRDQSGPGAQVPDAGAG